MYTYNYITFQSLSNTSLSVGICWHVTKGTQFARLIFSLLFLHLRVCSEVVQRESSTSLHNLFKQTLYKYYVKHFHNYHIFVVMFFTVISSTLHSLWLLI